MFRITTPEGNMNPQMGEVDIVPDDDLNTRLKFYVSDFKFPQVSLFLVIYLEDLSLFWAKFSKNWDQVFSGYEFLTFLSHLVKSGIFKKALV